MALALASPTAPVVAVLAAFTLVLGGCTSTSTSSAAAKAAGAAPPTISEENQKLARGCLSASEIRGYPLVTVKETVESVFTEAGFSLVGNTSDRLVFDRPASRRAVAAYGNWFGDAVSTRLKVEIQSQGTQAFFLRCRSYVAREGGTASEDEQSLARRHVREFEGLLPEVTARLGGISFIP